MGLQSCYYSASPILTRKKELRRFGSLLHVNVNSFDWLELLDLLNSLTVGHRRHLLPTLRALAQCLEVLDFFVMVEKEPFPRTANFSSIMANIGLPITNSGSDTGKRCTAVIQLTECN